MAPTNISYYLGPLSGLDGVLTGQVDMPSKASSVVSTLVGLWRLTVVGDLVSVAVFWMTVGWGQHLAGRPYVARLPWQGRDVALVIFFFFCKKLVVWDRCAVTLGR